MSTGPSMALAASGPQISGNLLPERPVTADEPSPTNPSAVAEPNRQQRLCRMTEDGFDSVWRLLRRLGVPAACAEDAAQEVFLIAARRIDVIAPGSEQSYLFGTALRVAKGFRRRGAKEALRHSDLDEAQLSGPATPEDQLDTRQRLELLDRALATLSDDERGVFVLFELEGLTLSEISQLMNVPRGTVASRLRRARSRFVRALAARRRARPQQGPGPNG